MKRQALFRRRQAFDAAHGAANGVRALAGQAKAAGATDQEIAEVIRVAYHLAGSLP